MLERALGGFEAFEFLDVGVRRVDGSPSGLETLKPSVNTMPPGADELDQEREIVDPRVPLGEQVTLEPLESANRLVQEAADLRDVARDREHLGAKPVTDCMADMCRNRGLELGRGGGERLDLVP